MSRYIYQSFINMSILSVKEWHDLRYTIKFNLPRQEETITETLLLYIKQHVPCIDKIIGFSKVAEAQNGADFQWTIINHRNNISYNMRFQAKRINNNLTTYDGIKRTIGKINPPPMQIQVFQTSSEADNCVPIYIFYNYLNDLSIIPNNCCSIDAGCKNQKDNYKVWGISISPAKKVRSNLIKIGSTKNNKTAFDQKVSTHIKDSMPIRCLFCPKYSGITDDREKKLNGENFQDAIMQKIRDLSQDMDESEGYDPKLGVVDGIPENVQEVLHTLKNFTDSPIPEERLTALSKSLMDAVL